MVNFTYARDGSRILDVATGTGQQAFAFAKRGYEVTGIDLSDAMLKIARNKNRYRNAKFEVADATRLPFEANSFDVSCASFALHDMPLSIREKALKEMVRVTKSEGMIVIVDYGLPKNKVGRSVVYHLVKLYEGKYYLEFIKSDFKELLGKCAIDIREEQQVLLGAGRILKGFKAKAAEGREWAEV